MPKMRCVGVPCENSSTYLNQSVQIRSHLTPSGLLFATLSLDTPSFEEFFAGLETLTNKVDFTKLPHRRSISYEGRFNWKTMFVFPSFIIPILTFAGSTASRNAFTASIHTLRSPNSTRRHFTPYPITLTSANILPTHPNLTMDSSCTSFPSARLTSTAVECLLSARSRRQTLGFRGWNLTTIIRGLTRSLRSISNSCGRLPWKILNSVRKRRRIWRWVFMGKES